MLAEIDQDEADRGPKERSSSPERFCIVAREARPADELIRFVIGPDGGLVPDLRRRLPGRGVWVTGTRTALATAVKRQAFRRSLKTEITAGPALVEQVGALIEKSVLDSLSIGHKAGQVVLGFAKVEATLAAGAAAALLHAREAAEDGVRKLAAAMRRGGDAAGPLVIHGFTSAQLDLALGRLNVIHAALPRGGAADAFIARWRMLSRFREESPEAADISERSQDA